MKKPELEELLKMEGLQIALGLANSMGANLYLVGGTIRNLILKRKIQDIDLIIDVKGEKYAHCLASRLKSKLIILGKEKFQTYRIPCGNFYLDIWDLKGEPLREDLWRRDFTINAIAMHLQSGEWIDPTCGFSDLKNKIIRWVNPSVFEEDPLRILRAFRFLVQLKNFSIEEGTLKGIVSSSHLIGKVAPERVLYEMDLIFSQKDLQRILLLMDEAKILYFLFPEVHNLKNVDQNFYHPDNAFEHTLNSLFHKDGALQWLYKNLEKFKKLSPEEELDLSYAILFHDIGKFSTRTEKGGRIHFYGHEKVGEGMARDILFRFKFSNVRKERICNLIRNHMKPLMIILNGCSEKAIRHFIYSTGENLRAQMGLFLCDFLSKNLEDEKPFDFIKRVWEIYRKEGKRIQKPKKIVSGEEVMKIFNLPPSEEVGKILKAVLRKQISGEIKNKREALKYLKELKEKKCNN
ncbi:MAG: HD domain-containing protein [Thermoanaerobaculia bacterium]